MSYEVNEVGTNAVSNISSGNSGLSPYGIMKSIGIALYFANPVAYPYYNLSVVKGHAKQKFKHNVDLNCRLV